MKSIILTILCFLTISVAVGQDRYLTKTGHVKFFSSSPMEDIEADNNQVLSIIDMKSGKMAIAILMKSFMFEKALMQEHFNENYVESDKYPKATFKGAIENFANFSTASMATIKGTIKIHGVEQPLTVTANVKKADGSIELTGDFIVKVADFDIKIPSVVAKNIAKEIKVSFKLNHKPYKK